MTKRRSLPLKLNEKSPLNEKSSQKKSKNQKPENDSPIIYTIERIVQKRWNGTNRVEYRIKWAEFDESHNTWEPAEKIHTSYVEEFERRMAEPAGPLPKFEKTQECQNTQTKGCDIMVFHPTMDEFRDFKGYIQKIEKEGAHLKNGICKIVPPKDWTPCPSGYQNVGNFVINNPIKEVIVGEDGVYGKVMLPQAKMTVQEFETMATRNEFSRPKNITNLFDLEKKAISSDYLIYSKAQENFIGSCYICDVCGYQKEGLLQCNNCCSGETTPRFYHATCAKLADIHFEVRDFPAVAVPICNRHRSDEPNKFSVGEKVFILTEKDGQYVKRKATICENLNDNSLKVTYLNDSIHADLSVTAIKNCECKFLGCNAEAGEHINGSIIYVEHPSTKQTCPAYYSGKNPTNYQVMLQGHKSKIETKADMIFSTTEPLPENARHLLMKRKLESKE